MGPTPSQRPDVTLSATQCIRTPATLARGLCWAHGCCRVGGASQLQAGPEPAAQPCSHPDQWSRHRPSWLRPEPRAWEQLGPQGQKDTSPWGRQAGRLSREERTPDQAKGKSKGSVWMGGV